MRIVFIFFHENKIGYFRCNGYGLAWRHRKHKPLFTERNGYKKVWPKYPARWRFEFLRPGNLVE